MSNRLPTRLKVNSLYILGLTAVGLTSAGASAFAWHTSLQLTETQRVISAAHQSAGQLISSLRDHLLRTEAANVEMQAQLQITTDRMKLTEGEISRARKAAAKITNEREQRLSALNTSMQTELAKKASIDNLNKLGAKVDDVKTDLEMTKNNLNMVRGEYGTLVSKNHDEIENLQRALTPQFPLHPSQWTSRIVIPDGLVVHDNGTETMGTALRRLRDALYHAQITEWTLFAFGQDGFVIVCRMETIYDNGVALPFPRRWTIDPLPPVTWTARTYVRALFTAPPGRYRVLVLAVTPLPVVAQQQEATSAELNRLLKSGAGDLPPDMKDRLVQPGTRCEALIYEFLRRRPSDDPRLVPLSAVTPVQHLAGAMLWTAAQLMPSGL